MNGEAMPLGERWLLGLFAALPAALVAAALLQLAPPPGLPPLSQRPLWLVWALIVGWLLMAGGLAWAGRRPLRLWRLGLGALAALLLLAALVSLWAGLPQGPAMALSLTLLAAGAFGLMRAVREGQRRPARPSGPTVRATARLAWWQRVVPHMRRHAGFWLSGALMLECFRMAYVVAVDPQRGVGMLGMLLVFFLVLPAVSLAAWLPRSAAVLLALASAGFASLGWLSALHRPMLAAVLLMLLAWRLARPHRPALAPLAQGASI
jgi:hypothetical protein